MERKDIINNKKTGWLNLTEVEKKNVFEFSEEYFDFLNKSKTEREFAKNAKELLDNNGFISEEVQNKLEVILNLEKEAILILKKNANCKLVVEENILKMIQSIINNYQPNKQAHEETAKAEKHNNF